MIPVQKGPAPPGLTALQQRAAGLSPAASYARLHDPLKSRVRSQLVHEQGGLCAYCMSRIPRTDAAPLLSPIVIEHIIPRNPGDGRDVGQGLDYGNLLAVCHGNKGPHGTRQFADLTCDAHRRNQEFQKVNPCQPATLATIFYHLDGRIDARDASVRADLVDTLNLNCPTAPLLAERKGALDALIEEMGRVPENDLDSWCAGVLSGFLAETSPKTPFVGILIWYLQNLLEALGGT